MGEKVGKWWDKLGKPQYGGEMVIRASRNIVNFDPYFGVGPVHIVTAWMERSLRTIGRWIRQYSTINRFGILPNI